MFGNRGTAAAVGDFGVWRSCGRLSLDGCPSALSVGSRWSWTGLLGGSG